MITCSCRQAFVENNGQFLDWQTSMAVSSFAAEMAELAPAFTSAERFYPTKKPRPHASVVGAVGTPMGTAEAPIKIVAKLLTEAVPARGVTPDYYCHTLVTVNPHSSPVAAEVVIAGLQEASGLPAGASMSSVQARRLMNGQYMTNLTTNSNGSVALSDMIDSRAANVRS